jgi:CRP-like cAMP-binding protein
MRRRGFWAARVHIEKKMILRHERSLLARKIGAFIQLSGPELEFLADLQSAPFALARGKELVHEGQLRQTAYILQAGWACSFKLLPNGGRQIITFPLPGDCVGLRSMLLRTSDHSFSAFTDALVTPIDAPRLKQMFIEFPHLGAAVLWATSRDEAMIVEHLVSVGRRSAIERTGHFFLELFDRLKLVGLTSQNEFDCPLDQYALADALGLSTIHVNRVLRRLREQKLMTFKGHKVVLHDLVALKALAGYESAQDSPVVIRDRGILSGT